MVFFHNLKTYWLLFFICHIHIETFSQLADVDHWEMVIIEGQEWNYQPGTSVFSPEWNIPGFDDSSWLQGASGIGYGDGDDQTIIDPAISLYMRQKFDLIDTSKIAALVYYMDYDDAFVAYLNGEEIARSNISGNPPQYNSLASSLHEALLYNGISPEEFQINNELIKSTIREGENVLAVQVHNFTAGSSDMTAIPFLAVGVKDTSRTYLNTPEWFTPPVDYTLSELPILVINTFNQTIIDEPRINAWLSVINKGEGAINSIFDPVTGYDGWISIEIRGESAQMFAKKSYSFETQDSVGENNNVSLLGLPEENDWILYGPYSDKTLIKNVLSYKLARDMGRYATRTSFCELFINGNYKGLYVLMEKIKKDKNRVDISKLRETDISGDQLTGGYIIRVDKIDVNDYPPWTSYPATGLHGEDAITFQFFDPDGWALEPRQQEYIMDFIKEFENVLNSSYYLDQEKGFKAYADIHSFVDYIIVNELAKNVDAYIFSTYMYKNRDSKGGKLNMGPVWDFNISYGNVNYNNSAVQTDGWIYTDNWRMYWFRRMMKDRIASNYMNCRWHELRSGLFSEEKIFGYIDSLINQLQGPIEKNYKRWPVLGTYIWPNVFIGASYEEEISHLKAWIQDRLTWMDNQIPFECVTGLQIDRYEYEDISVYPNPFTEKVLFLTEGSNHIQRILIYDKTGRLIKKIVPSSPQNASRHLEWSGKNFYGNHLESGLYLALIELMNGESVSRKIVKR